jgi:hypothetical protein
MVICLFQVIVFGYALFMILVIALHDVRCDQGLPVWKNGDYRLKRILSFQYKRSKTEITTSHMKMAAILAFILSFIPYHLILLMPILIP